MSQERLLCAIVVAAVLTFSGCSDDVDRDSYVERNEAIRKSLPTFPGATLVSIKHSPSRRVEGDDLGAIVSYGTGVDYRVHAGTRPREVADFYRRRLKGWRVARSTGLWVKRADSGPHPPVSRWFVRGNASIALDLNDLLPGVRDNPRGKGGRILHVGIDHNYYGTRDQ